MIDALARHGDGLPARVLPLRVNEVTALDLVAARRRLRLGRGAAARAAAGTRAHGTEGMFRNLETANAVLAGLGSSAHGAPRAAAIETDDPFTLGEALRRAAARAACPSRHRPTRRSARRGRWLRQAARALAERRAAPRRRDRDAGARALRRGAGGRGGLHALPRLHQRLPDLGALSANPETPQLRFLEDACVQCGLCAATCPEKVITLEPRLNLRRTPRSRAW